MRNHEAIMRALRELPEVEGEDFASTWARAWEVVHPGEPPFVANEAVGRLVVRNLMGLEGRLARLERECADAGLVKPRPGQGQEATLTRHLQNLREGRPLWDGIEDRSVELEFEVRSTLDDGGAPWMPGQDGR